MKQFRYSLENVLDYKAQVLDNLKVEHAVIMKSVTSKQEEINRLNHTLISFEQDFDKAKTQGASIEQFRLCDMCIGRMEEIIHMEKEQLHALKMKEEGKKKEVITAKVDTSKFEHLKKKKQQEYRKAEMKEEENFVEEFVSHGLLHNRRQSR